MTRGRKPTPTPLKVLRGNPGKRKISDALRTDAKIPPCPDVLQGEARSEWTRVTKVLFKLGIISDLDRAMIACYCQAWQLWHEATRQIAENGVVVRAATGTPMQNPWLAIANKQYSIMRQIASEFGLTPSSLSRIKPPGSNKAPGKLAKYV